MLMFTLGNTYMTVGQKLYYNLVWVEYPFKNPELQLNQYTSIQQGTQKSMFTLFIMIHTKQSFLNPLSLPTKMALQTMSSVTLMGEFNATLITQQRHSQQPPCSLFFSLHGGG